MSCKMVGVKENKISFNYFQYKAFKIIAFVIWLNICSIRNRNRNRNTKLVQNSSNEKKLLASAKPLVLSTLLVTLTDRQYQSHTKTQIIIIINILTLLFHKTSFSLFCCYCCCCFFSATHFESFTTFVHAYLNIKISRKRTLKTMVLPLHKNTQQRRSNKKNGRMKRELKTL